MKRSRRVAPPGRWVRGFSYLWILLLVALMGTGLTAAVEIDATASRREKEKELLAIGRQFRTALARYHEAQQVAGRKEYPADLEDLLKDARFAGVRRHLRKVFVDPITGKAEWGLVRVGGRIVGVHSLSEQRPIKQDRFDAENASFKGKERYAEWVFTYPPDALVHVASETEGGLPSGDRDDHGEAP